jgi:hypothetical protein
MITIENTINEISIFDGIIKMTAMEIIRFKTNIQTQNALEKITTGLDNVAGLN